MKGLLILFVFFGLVRSGYCTDVDYSSEGLVYKQETTTTTKPIKLNIKDEIELQINQINELKREQSIEYKKTIEKVKKAAKKAGYKIIIQNGKIQIKH